MYWMILSKTDRPFPSRDTWPADTVEASPKAGLINVTAAPRAFVIAKDGFGDLARKGAKATAHCAEVGRSSTTREHNFFCSVFANSLPAWLTSESILIGKLAAVSQQELSQRHTITIQVLQYQTHSE